MRELLLQLTASNTLIFPAVPLAPLVLVTMTLLAARFVDGTKLLIAFKEESAIVPEIELTVRSALVSPA